MRQHRVSRADKAFYFALFYTLVFGIFFMAYYGAEYKAEQYKIEYGYQDYDYGPLAYDFVETYCQGNYSDSIQNLTLREKMGQMLIAKADSTNADSIGKTGVGGVYLVGMKSKDAYKDIIERSKKSSKIPLFVSLDLEGYFNPFSDFHGFPSAGEMGKMSDSEVYETAADMARLCKELGFNLNFAPVVDLSYGDDVWGGRAFSRDAGIVIDKAKAFVKGFQDQCILTVAKHFPGRTISAVDTHLSGASAEINEGDLMPFYSMAESGVDGIMINHLIASGKVESNGVPASVSKEAVGYLRGFFHGLILTDDLSMGAISSSYTPKPIVCIIEKGGCSTKEGTKQIFIDAVNAGNDILLVTSLVEAGEIEEVISAIENAVLSGEIEEETISEAVARIFKYKCRLFD